MVIYNVSDLASEHKGEYVLGLEDLHTHACYLIYGFMKPGEKGRVLKPGSGHEEIVCLVQGKVLLSNSSGRFVLDQGQAFHLKGDETYMMDNEAGTDAVYMISGGHSKGHGH
ncbi:MAG: hypothetical protein AABY42_06000 [Nitrospirota bacterium]